MSELCTLAKDTLVFDTDGLAWIQGPYIFLQDTRQVLHSYALQEHDKLMSGTAR